MYLSIETDLGQPVAGTCCTMCPEEEIKMRERENLLHPFEVAPDHHPKRPKADRHKMVKEYTRPAPGKEDPNPSQIRTPQALVSTVNYLINCVGTKESHSWSEIYDFIFDRMRSVRQDMTVQDLEGKEAVEILEKIVRFHVYSDYCLCTKPISVFDPKINDQHIQECLKRLLNLYICHPELTRNRAEFEALYLLFNLGDTEALRHSLNSSTQLRYSQIVRSAYKASLAMLLGNWVQIWKTFHSFQHHPMLQCALHRHFPVIQRHILQAMNTAYSSKVLSVPTQYICQQLCIDETELESLTAFLGLQVQHQHVTLSKTAIQHITQIPRRHNASIDKNLDKWTIPHLLLGSTDVKELERALDSIHL
ncbi:hypothetical protein CHS0354_003422 [Potamilus streckersoni]|uniref:SAC3/GANP/THP3 conserved domain-containing protein n=1 Tax=Potamilus streckersoni TaxID=2493646 RepID=A0AAE0SPA8_9BIVA|nr:hypothetical protein CHS0354_003422 [Potamilus streckersoni]